MATKATPDLSSVFGRERGYWLDGQEGKLVPAEEFLDERSARERSL